MELATAEQQRQLIDNWNLEGDALQPVVKIFSPVGSATWLIASMNPQDEDTMYGLCDLGLDYSEIGYMRLSELQSVIIASRPPAPSALALNRTCTSSPATRSTSMQKRLGRTAPSPTILGC